MRLSDLTDYLDRYLEIARFSDASANGLQVENSGRVDKVGLAVDASLAAIGMAANAGCGFLLVHHGLTWGEPLLIRGHHYRRIRALITADLALYAAHLPLDAHPEVGHNVRIARALGLSDTRPFGLYAGSFVGVQGLLSRQLSREEALLHCRKEVGPETTCFWFGPESIARVGIVSGSATDPALFEEAARAGIDLFVTGEPKHAAYNLASEIGLNIFYGGHYRTETFGVRALGSHLAERFGLTVEYLETGCPL
jgi:dinuclear metal center YbgI/SA1388 family protein